MDKSDRDFFVHHLTSRYEISEADYNKYETVAGARSPNSDFRASIVLAIFDWEGPRDLRKIEGLKFEDVKIEDIIKQTKMISQRAADAARHVERLHKALEKYPKSGHLILKPWTPLGRDGERTLIKFLDGLKQLSSDMQACFVGMSSHSRKGRPPMRKFTAFIESLRLAFRQATNREAKVTYRVEDNTYGGPFVRLVEALIPKLQALMDAQYPTWDMPQTPYARGKYISDITRSPRSKAGSRKKI